MSAESDPKILELLGGREPDLVMSDMAPNACGSHSADHDAIVNLGCNSINIKDLG